MLCLQLHSLMAEFEERLFAKVDSEVDIIYNKANEGESDNDEDDVAEGEDTEGWSSAYCREDGGK